MSIHTGDKLFPKTLVHRVFKCAGIRRSTPGGTTSVCGGVLYLGGCGPTHRSPRNALSPRTALPPDIRARTIEAAAARVELARGAGRSRGVAVVARPAAATAGQRPAAPRPR
eukprot:364709-Chlamydomonas_euryale.AAC.21